MINNKMIIYSLFVVSSSTLCFEILATRITSVIFVNHFAFIIISLAILGLSLGAIFAHYYFDKGNSTSLISSLSKNLILLSISYLIFFLFSSIDAIATNYFLYFATITIPFFLSGIFYANVFKHFADISYKIYGADLIGSATGSILAIVLTTYLNPSNGILAISILLLSVALSISISQYNKLYNIISFFITLSLLGFLSLNGQNSILNKIPIGEFAEKDFHFTYPNRNVQKIITDSRWSIYGRADLVEYNHQDVVRHLFIDGAAGTPMLRFDGNLNNQDPILSKLLLESSGFIPLLLLQPNEKNNMLVIGPGGGREILGGLLTGVNDIVGIEINPDFVNLVNDNESFNGGIYSQFPNIEIKIGEGRQYVKRSKENYDIIFMSLPSTQQLQSIDNFALSENHLLTVEAIEDYLNNLTDEGRLIFTMHNTWELKRLIVTIIKAFKKTGLNANNIFNHLIIFESEYAPSIIVQKKPYSREQIDNRFQLMNTLTEEAPDLTYVPFFWDNLQNTTVNNFLRRIKNGNTNSLNVIIDSYDYDLKPVSDDNPYFFNIEKGIPSLYSKLTILVLILCLVVLIIPFLSIRKSVSHNDYNNLILLILLFTCIGVGFMMIEISLFQKLILYLGSPTISLSVLLSSLLIGMGVGSYKINSISFKTIRKKIGLTCAIIIGLGLIVIFLYPIILEYLLPYNLVLRAIVTFVLMLPFGFFLGIPFPSLIDLLNKNGLNEFIPWMYGINGSMSVLGSILAVLLSMSTGYTPSFLVGLTFYLLVCLITLSPTMARTFPK